MDSLLGMMGMLQMIAILLAPIGIPLIMRRWVWFRTVLVGLGLYAAFAIYCIFGNGDVTEYGTGLAMLYLPFMGIVFFIGLFRECSSQRE